MDDMQFAPIIAHRGASAYATENSLLALEMVAEFDTNWVEYDVQLTADGQLVVVHDENLKRLTGESIVVTESTLAEIKALPLLHSEQEGVRQYIPTLEEWLDVATALKFKHNLELKCQQDTARPLAEAVARCIKVYGLSPDQVMFSSFCLPAMQAVQQLLPDYWRACLFRVWQEDWQQQAESIGARSIHLRSTIVTEERVAAIHAAGYQCLVFTINRKKTAEKLLAMGVDALFSNYPDLLV